MKRLNNLGGRAGGLLDKISSDRIQQSHIAQSEYFDVLRNGVSKMEKNHVKNNFCFLKRLPLNSYVNIKIRSENLTLLA